MCASAWGSCDDLSFASIDLTVHRGGLLGGGCGRSAASRVGAAPAAAHAHCSWENSCEKRARPPRGRRGASGAFGAPRSESHFTVFLRDLEQPSAGYHAGRLRRSHCQGSRFISPTSGPKRNMCASSAKLSICDCRADRTASSHSFTVRCTCRCATRCDRERWNESLLGSRSLGRGLSGGFS